MREHSMIARLQETYVNGTQSILEYFYANLLQAQSN